MSLKTGDQITLTIHDLAFGGDGVGRIPMPRDEGQVTSDQSAASSATRHPSPILMDGQGVIHLLDETRFLGEHLRDELFPPSPRSGAAEKQTVGLVDASD